MAGGHGPSLSSYIFDAGPLSAFARTSRLDVLQERYTGHASWTKEVENEIQRGSIAYPQLAEILAIDWLGEPISITDPEDLRRMERLRWALGGGNENPEKHRGEAATIVAASLTEGIAALDDLDARRLAENQGIPIIGTLGILRACVTDGQLSQEEAWDLSQAMRGIRTRFPNWLNPEYFNS